MCLGMPVWESRGSARVCVRGNVRIFARLSVWCGGMHSELECERTFGGGVKNTLPLAISLVSGREWPATEKMRQGRRELSTALHRYGNRIERTFREHSAKA